jgi:hypothetical protein
MLSKACKRPPAAASAATRQRCGKAQAARARQRARPCPAPAAEPGQLYSRGARGPPSRGGALGPSQWLPVGAPGTEGPATSAAAVRARPLPLVPGPAPRRPRVAALARPGQRRRRAVAEYIMCSWAMARPLPAGGAHPPCRPQISYPCPPSPSSSSLAPEPQEPIRPLGRPAPSAARAARSAARALELRRPVAQRGRRQRQLAQLRQAAHVRREALGSGQEQAGGVPAVACAGGRVRAGEGG